MSNYPFNTDLYQYMIANEAPQTVIDQFNDVIVHKADNKDFFQWSEPRNGILMPNPEYLRQRLAHLNTAGGCESRWYCEHPRFGARCFKSR